MARFPKVPGAGAKAINNPVYWSRMHLQNERYRAMSRNAVERFNERWHRLIKIQNEIAEDYSDAVINRMNERDTDKLLDLINEMQFWNKEIDENIDIANNSHLSKYATRIKNFSLHAIKMCIKYNVFSNVEFVTFDAKKKILSIDDEVFYHFA